MKHIDLAISGMSCGHCVNSVRTALGTVPALEVIGVTIGSATIAVDPSNATPDAVVAEALAAVSKAGFGGTISNSVSPTVTNAAASGTRHAGH